MFITVLSLVAVLLTPALLHCGIFGLLFIVILANSAWPATVGGCLLLALALALLNIGAALIVRRWRRWQTERLLGCSFVEV